MNGLFPGLEIRLEDGVVEAHILGTRYNLFGFERRKSSGNLLLKKCLFNLENVN